MRGWGAWGALALWAALVACAGFLLLRAARSGACIEHRPYPTNAPRSTPCPQGEEPGSRYVSWLPSFSVEVTRVRAPPAQPHQLEAMARQVQQLFPQYGVGALLADLAATRSPDLTANNILEGRLPPPAPSHTEPHNVPDISASEILHVPRVLPPPPARDAATNTAPPPPPALPAPTALPTAPTDAPPAAPTLETTTSSATYVYQAECEFSCSAAEREAALARRKQQLRAAARARYLHRHAPVPHPSHPAPRTPSDS